MRRRELLCFLAAAAAAPRTLLAQSFNDDARVQQFIEHLYREHAFAPAELKAFFSRLSYDKRILQLIGAPDDGKPKKKTYWRQYRKQRLTSKKIAAGISFHRQHQPLMQRVQEQYGIPAAVITAIIGIETHYGAHTGKYSVAQTLATLSFGHPQRGQEFLDELTEFLLYARDAGIDPIEVSGSYAGAIGMVQFMPSSIRKYAIDFDGDQRINLYAADDAIASAGNFLSRHGWRRDISGITYPADIDSARAHPLIALTAENKYQALMSADELKQHGVKTSTPATPAARYVFIDLENRYDTEYRVGNQNFYALTRYNKSFKYAAVVADLAAEIAKHIT